MRRLASVGVWGPLLGFVGAVATVVFVVLGQPLPAAAAVVVALGAVLSTVFELWRAAKREREAEEDRQRELLVEIQPVEEVDATAIGVHPAAVGEPGRGLKPLDYVRRDVDGELDQALGGVLDGSTEWIVVVHGPPTVGKSRTLFEGLRRLAGKGQRLRLVAPADGASLRALSRRVRRRSWRRGRLVLWLDDLEDFVAEQIGFKELEQWRRKNAIVVATYGGKGGDRELSEGPGWASLAENVLSHARRVGLQATTPEEVRQLPESFAAVSREAIAKYGLAAALVAAPALEVKLSSQRDVGGPRSPAGAAIVYTAINWARCGRTDPIDREALGELWSSHLRERVEPTEEAFKQGLAWALTPVAGSISLLDEVANGGFRANDHLGAAVEDLEVPRISEETWRRALDTEEPAQAFNVGMAAHAARRMSDAERALSLASSRDDSEVAGPASYNLGLLLREQKEAEGAERAFERAKELGSPGVREQAGRAAIERAAAEEVQGLDEDTRASIERQFRDEHDGGEEATFIWGEDVYRDAIDRGDGGAADDLGLAMMARGEMKEAEQMFRRALELGFKPASVHLGVVLDETGDPGGAEGAYREAMDYGLAEGAFNLALLLKDKDDLPGAEEALLKAVALGHGPAAYNLGVLLGDRDDLAGAEKAFRQALDRGFPDAAEALGALLIRQGRLEEAEAYFRRMVAQGQDGAVFLARSLVEQGKLAEAEAALAPVAEEKDLRLDLIFALLLEQMGHPDAEEALRRAEEKLDEDD